MKKRLKPVDKEIQLEIQLDKLDPYKDIHTTDYLKAEKRINDDVWREVYHQALVPLIRETSKFLYPS